MQNKLPIGQTADATQVGGGGTGNDQANLEALGSITHERKRPRYSIFAMAANGANFYSPAGVWDVISGGTVEQSVISGENAPYDFSFATSMAIPTLTFTAKVDGGANQTITFAISTFVDPENVTAAEMAEILSGLAGATASVIEDPFAGTAGVRVKIVSDSVSGSVEVIDTITNLLLRFPLGGGPTAPNRTSPGAAPSSFSNGAGNSMQFEYEAREPTIFIGGQLFIGEVTNGETAGDPISGSTTIHVEKVDSASSDNVVSIDTHTHSHGPFKQGPDLDNKNILIRVPGARSQFATGERFRFRVVPSGAGYDTETRGLRGVSAVLWFKALHR